MSEQSLNNTHFARIQLLPLSADYFEQVVNLANEVHGDGYLDFATLQQWIRQGCLKSTNASVIALYEQQVLAYRISFAAGQWQTDRWCSTALWPDPVSDTAYFKSVAVKANWQGQGIGQKLLKASIAVLKAQGAKAGIAHLWRESPNNSAVRYFSKAGGRLIAIHENRWQHLSLQGYDCPRCKGLCQCSAAEMVLRF